VLSHVLGKLGLVDVRLHMQTRECPEPVKVALGKAAAFSQLTIS
jgi:hypothetical protein